MELGKENCTICNNKFILTETQDCVDNEKDMNRIGCEFNKCTEEVKQKCLKILKLWTT